MKIVVDKSLVNYQIQGSGPAVVLLHGWGDNLSTFKELTKFLKSDYTVISLDLLGFGESELPKDTYDLEKYAKFVSDFLLKIDQPHVYAFVGHSNGGAICIRGISSGLLKSERLVLLASSGVRSTYNKRKNFLRASAKVAKLMTVVLPESTQMKIKRKVYKKLGSDLFVAEHLQDTFKKVVSEDVVHEAAMIIQPTLLIYGSADRATPVKYGETFAQQIENSVLKIIDGADHFLHHTHSKEVNKLVMDFLDK
jgi:pimeloyl-ACP methyl ester carboxylesterase